MPWMTIQEAHHRGAIPGILRMTGQDGGGSTLSQTVQNKAHTEMMFSGALLVVRHI
jgi:hypothetical protein